MSEEFIEKTQNLLEGTLKMTKAYVYILECSDGSYYTGSTIDLEKRLNQHQNGLGANHTKKRLPVKLVYAEEFTRVDEAFYREKQIQGWSRNKKEALIEKNYDNLPKLSVAYRDKVSSRTSDTARAADTMKMKDDLVPEALEGTPLESKKKSQIFRSNGKLLLTGEYVVLDGALALAVPTRDGQSLSVKPIETSKIYWKSFDDQKRIWFETKLDLDVIFNATLAEIHPDEPNSRLLQILCAVRKLNSNFLSDNKGFEIETHLDFPKNWGLGTSSTLINNIAQWANVDAFKLLALTFGGSGYDIACAQHNTSITYQLSEDIPIVTPVTFEPSFKDKLYFIYLNKKQNSRKGIAHYKSLEYDLQPVISKINKITSQMMSCETLGEFQKLLEIHEQIISDVTQQDTVTSSYFDDFDGAIKSLGAWGGDFILAASENNPTTYFNQKGFNTVIPYTKMIL